MKIFSKFVNLTYIIKQLVLFNKSIKNNKNKIHNNYWYLIIYVIE